MKESLDDLMSEIRQRLRVFERHLPRQIDPLAMSRSKLPFKALLYREALIWRVTELGMAAFENFDANRLAAAILLTRAAVETTAVLWYLCNKITTALKAGSLGDIDDYLMRLSLGSRVWEELPDTINVLTFVDCVNKTVDGFRRQYDSLSEYSHPNYSGTTGLYSKNDTENILIDFGSNVRSTDGPKHIGVINLSVALTMFEHTYNKLADVMSDFVALCEKNLPS
jgi:hypothetical protein